jgi:hypothetical protein
MPAFLFEVPLLVNVNGGRQNALKAVKDLLWKALERSHGLRSKVEATNEFKLDDKFMDQLGDRPVIFNNQINRIDVRMHADIYAAIKRLDAIEFIDLKSDVTIDDFIRAAYNLGINLDELQDRVERSYLQLASEDFKSKAAAARRIGLKRTTFVNKVKRLDK